MQIKYFFSLLLGCWINLLAAQAVMEGFALSNGVQVYYKSFGEGQPLLLINGGPGFSSEGFAPLAKKLAAHNRVIIYDQRGTGQSQLTKRDSTTITMDLMVKDIENLREHLNIEEWLVMGHSFGGMLAAYYASKHPDCISGMIMSSSGGLDLGLLNGLGIRNRLSDIERDSLDYWTNRIQAGDNSENARLKRATFLAPAYLYNKSYVPIVAERLTQGDLALNGIVWQDMQRIGFDTKDALINFQKPVLIIQGQEDVIAKSVAETADQTFPQSTLTFLPKAGHYGWLDQPKKYFGAIHQFLDTFRSENEIAIRKVLTNYIESIYQADSTLVAEVTTEKLQKSGYFYSKKNKEWSYHDMTFSGLEHTASTYNAEKWIPENAPQAVQIFEINDKTASAKIEAIWGFDYVLLSKNQEEKWIMDKVLWQSYNPTTE